MDHCLPAGIVDLHPVIPARDWYGGDEPDDYHRGRAEQGLYRPLALSLQKALTRLGRKSEVRTTEGTLENLKLVAEGKADFALFQPGAYEGLKRFEPELLQGESRRIDATGLEQVAFVANLYSQPLHIAVREECGIESLMDLKGKRVNLGVKLSGDYPMARMLMDTSRSKWRSGIRT